MAKQLRFSFSLRTLLITVTLVAVVLGSLLRRAERRRRAVKQFRDNGFQVYYDFHYAPEDLADVTRPETTRNPRIPYFLEKYVGIDLFHSVVCIRQTELPTIAVSDLPFGDLRSIRKVHAVSCDSLAALTSLRQLEYLSLSFVDDLQPLKNLTQLRSLHISFAGTFEDLRAFGDLADLEVLVINGPVESLHGIQGLRKLQHLSVSGGLMTSLDGLPASNQIRQLRVGDAMLTDLSHLRHCTSLELLHLGLSHEQIDLTPLSNCTNLSELHLERGRFSTFAPLGNTEIQKFYLEASDLQALAGIEKVRKLELLDISNCQFTDVSRLMRLPALETVTAWNDFELNQTLRSQFDRLEERTPKVHIMD